jgi:N4-gp56 family major capsid protein
MANTTRTEIPVENTEFYSRELLERALPALVHNRWAQVRDIPAGGGTDTIKFRKYSSLATNTTALSEGVTPSGKQLSVTDVTAQVLYYGDFVTITDKVNYETKDPILTETADILGEQAGLSLDDLVKNVLAAGTVVQYASTATARTEITAAMKLTRAEIKEAVRTLRTANAKPITNMIDPNDAYNTVPVGRSFVGIVSEDTLYDLDDAEGWIPVEKYPSQVNTMLDEVGSCANVRFVMTTNAKVFTSGGSGLVDVHGTLILGDNAYCVTRLAGKALQNIVKPLGSAGSADPLDQRATSGWKATFVAKILQQSFMIRIEHGVTA